MLQHESSIQLDKIATEWAIRVDAGPLTEEEAHALDAWLSISLRHRGAYERACAAFVLMDGQFIRDAEKSFPQASPISRRQLLYGGIGSAIAAGAAFAFVMRQDQTATTRYDATQGQIRVVSLADGSLVTLDSASQIVVTMSAKKRHVELVTGRALFDVAKDQNRPFIVSGSGTSVRAVGTSFSVRNIETLPVEVLVREGIVDVGGSTIDHPTRVGSNMRVVAQSGRGAPFSVTAVAESAVARELSWREGLLAFEDVKIGIGAQLFARYSNQRIVISDPAVAEITITGLFASNDPLGFANAAATSLGLKLEKAGNEIRLTR